MKGWVSAAACPERRCGQSSRPRLEAGGGGGLRRCVVGHGVIRSALQEDSCSLAQGELKEEREEGEK